MLPEELIAYVARSLVTDPSAVRVALEPSEERTVIRLSVADSDLGRVIGEKGKTVHAIRNILLGAGAKHNSRYSLVVVEPEPSPGSNIERTASQGAAYTGNYRERNPSIEHPMG